MLCTFKNFLFNELRKPFLIFTRINARDTLAVWFAPAFTYLFEIGFCSLLYVVLLQVVDDAKMVDLLVRLCFVNLFLDICSWIRCTSVHVDVFFWSNDWLSVHLNWRVELHKGVFAHKFDQHKKWVVHEIVITEKLRVKINNVLVIFDLGIREVYKCFAQVSAYLYEIIILHTFLVVQLLRPPRLFEFRQSSICTPFNIKNHLIMVLTLHLGRVLHNDEINWSKQISLDGKHSIYSRDQTLVVRNFIMFYQIIKHS